MNTTLNKLEIKFLHDQMSYRRAWFVNLLGYYNENNKVIETSTQYINKIDYILEKITNGMSFSEEEKDFIFHQLLERKVYLINLYRVKQDDEKKAVELKNTLESLDILLEKMFA